MRLPWCSCGKIHCKHLTLKTTLQLQDCNWISFDYNWVSWYPLAFKAEEFEGLSCSILACNNKQNMASTYLSLNSKGNLALQEL